MTRTRRGTYTREHRVRTRNHTTNTWTMNAACPTTDGAYCNDIPIAADQTAGAYTAPLTIEVISP
jgi:hypothetical protein